MKKPLALVLAAGLVTAAAATLHPGQPAPVPPPLDPADPAALAASGQQRIEVVFVLDTTGSMGGMIDAAKRRIWSIAAAMAGARPAPEIRIGLVAYRDRGDAYVTRRVALTPDLDAVHAALMQLRADGGGDTPESVNQALHEAIHDMAWSQEEGVYRTVFLVGDAPPHDDYRDDTPWQRTLAAARARDIVVNTLLCGDHHGARRVWEAIARENQGRFLAVDSSGGALEIDTPYDAELARLSEALDRTRLRYGSDAERERDAARAAREAKLRATAPAATLADRAVYKATAAGRSSLRARSDLVEAVLAGELSLEAVPEEALPEPLRDLDPAAREAELRRIAAERASLRREIGAVAARREAFLEEARSERADAPASLDAQLLDTLAEQAAARGLEMRTRPDR